MPAMKISVVNRTTKLADAAVRRTIDAINRQFAEHFEPHWQFGARLRLDEDEERALRRDHVENGKLVGRLGEAVIYLLDEPTITGAEGFHDRNKGDMPFGFVFLDVCDAVGDPWSVALSHEAIELVGDPMNNLLVQGPHPEDSRHLVFHMFELCDAVQSQSYEIDDIAVSNFVLPGYFTRGEVDGRANDFLGRRHDDASLRSFGLVPGGYICFYDSLRIGDKWHPFAQPDDLVARKRLDVKQTAGHGRIGRRQGHR
jgi:hypothetical protein